LTPAVLVRGLLGQQPHEVRHDLHAVDEGAAGSRIEALRLMTALGGDNDPRAEAAAEVWLSLISTLLGISPKLARTWYAALVEAAFDTDDPIHHRALAAYVVGVVEAHVGNDLRADHWLEVGRTEAEFDDDQFKPFLDACDFVKGAVPRR
jgi:hypothetical protein